MNQIFSLKRFAMLFKKHTVENLKGYGMMLIVFLGILIISTIITNYHSDEPHQTVPYMMYLVAAGTIFTSTVFMDLGEKRRAIATLTLPATTLEKFLVGWLYSYVIFQIIYTALYYGVTIAAIDLGTWRRDVKLFNIFDPETKIYYIFIAYTALHSIALFGAIAFKKMHFIKTAFVVFLIGAPVWLINNRILGAMIHQDIHGNPPLFGASFRDSKNDYHNLELPHFTGWVIVLYLSLSVMVWVAAYFKLKEKQV